MNNKAVCVHGHFYQPPRENPWLESIEQQDSAYPFHDWNERINAECYAPNAWSRILDADGRILRIVSNYARMSFNMGPTLLAWMETAAPDVYEAVLAADRAGQERFDGHGTAVAQVYNHLIMPLATTRDKTTQIRWGIRDFEWRFGRKPEGMWLAETAVDTETLRLMAEEGIAFTILEPHQISSARKLGQKDWTDVSGGQVDPTHPYRVDLGNGQSIAVFVYDRPVSQALAFEGLLTDGDRFADRLIGLLAEDDVPQLVNVASDGETYGHHQRHGDMALAWALEKIDADPEVGLAVYAQWLEHHPPTHEVTIVDNTAWSCVHGVGRWHTDCGCNSGMHGEWHQRWRQPLRDALDWLRDEVGVAFEAQASAVFDDVWAARDAYIEVVLDRSEDSVRAFLNAHGAGNVDGLDDVLALQLMEIQRYAMLMYTSCGWFFDELSGIETVQVIQYASRVIQLARRALGLDLEGEFIERLSPAESNLPAFGNGGEVYRRHVAPAKVDLATVAAHHAMTGLFDEHEPTAQVHAFEVETLHNRYGRAGRWSTAVGQMNITSTITRESSRLTYGVLHFGDHNLTGGVTDLVDEDHYQAVEDAIFASFDRADLPATLRELDGQFTSQPYSLATLFRDDQRRIVTQIVADTLEEVADQTRSLYEDKVPLMRFLASIGVPIPDELRSTARVVLSHELGMLLADPDLDVDQADLLLHDVQEFEITVDRAGLGYQLVNTIQSAMTVWEGDAQNFEALDRVTRLVDLANRAQLDADLAEAQNRFYQLKEIVFPVVAKRTSTPARKWAARFRQLGAALAVKVE